MVGLGCVLQQKPCSRSAEKVTPEIVLLPKAAVAPRALFGFVTTVGTVPVAFAIL